MKCPYNLHFGKISQDEKTRIHSPFRWYTFANKFKLHGNFCFPPYRWIFRDTLYTLIRDRRIYKTWICLRTTITICVVCVLQIALWVYRKQQSGDRTKIIICIFGPEMKNSTSRKKRSKVDEVTIVFLMGSLELEIERNGLYSDLLFSKKKWLFAV